MSAPQSVQKMPYKSNYLGAQGSTQPLKINASFYRSKHLAPPFWIGQYYDKNVICLQASL